MGGGEAVEVVDHVGVVGPFLVEIEVALVEEVEFQSSYLAVNSALTSIVPWTAVQMIASCGHTCFETAGVDVDMTWVRLMRNLVQLQLS